MAHWTMDVPGSESMVPLVRRWTREVLANSPLVSAVELVLCELVTNAIRHSASGEAGGIIRIALDEVDDKIRVVVDDDGPRKGRADHWTAELADDFGRGMTVIGEFSPFWGEEKDADGTRRTWAEVAVPL